MKYNPYEKREPAPFVEPKQVSIHREGTTIFIKIGDDEQHCIFGTSEQMAENTMLGLAEHYGISPAQPAHTDNAKPH